MQKITLPLSFFCELVLENLPISSSGHLAFFSSFFPVLGGELSPLLNHFAHAFVIVTQGFFLIPFLRGPLKVVSNKEFLTLFIHLFLMNIITVLSYFLKTFLAFPMPLFWGFFLTAFFLLSIDKTKEGEKNIFSLSWEDAFFLGIVQSIALLPGVSRFGAVLFAGFYRGLFYYDSFILAIMSNIFIAGESLLYLFYHIITSKSLLFSIGEEEALLLIVSLCFSMAILLFFYFLFRKKLLSFFGLYVFFVGILAFYLLSYNLNFIRLMI